MMVLAKSFSAASLSASSALLASSPSSSMSNTLPCRTLAPPPMPSAFSAPSIALPCGSSTPDFKVTVTRAFMRCISSLPLQRGGMGWGSRPPPDRYAVDLPFKGRFSERVVARSLLRIQRNSSALDQDRPGALMLRHDAEALGHLGIGFEQAAEIAAEAILVELFARLDVPQPAGIRRDLVGDDDSHHVVFPQPPAFHLEIDQPDADPEKKSREEVVDPDGERHDVVDLLRRRPAERGDMLLGYHRIAERVVLVIELDDRARQLRALLDAEPLAERASRDISHHHLQR